MTILTRISIKMLKDARIDLWLLVRSQLIKQQNFYFLTFAEAWLFWPRWTFPLWLLLSWFSQFQLCTRWLKDMSNILRQYWHLLLIQVIFVLFRCFYLWIDSKSVESGVGSHGSTLFSRYLLDDDLWYDLRISGCFLSN